MFFFDRPVVFVRLTILYAEMKHFFKFLVVFVLGGCSIVGTYTSVDSCFPNERSFFIDSTGRSRNFKLPYQQLKIKSFGRLRYKKIHRGDLADLDFELNTNGYWRVTNDTLLLNFPTDYRDQWIAFIAFNDTLYPVNENQTNCFVLEK